MTPTVIKTLALLPLGVVALLIAACAAYCLFKEK